MSTDLTPEHSARPWASVGYPEVEAAYRYVDGMVKHADIPIQGWHGWALREAFLAGCTHHQHLDELCDNAFKAGSLAAIESMQVGLERGWLFRVAIRLFPGLVLKKFKEKIEEVLPIAR
jgi:hypothetical protein